VAACELGFINKVGDIWTEGHQDLIYRPRENPLALATTDWKTGAQKPHQLLLDHGFESSFYSAAIRDGLFLPSGVVQERQELASDDRPIALDSWDIPALVHARDDREAMHISLRSMARRSERGDTLPEEAMRFGEFPEVIRLTPLADYELYKKKGDKSVE